MSNLIKIGNRHKSHQIAKHKTDGKYSRQRDRTRLNKIRIIKKALGSSPSNTTLLDRLTYWQNSIYSYKSIV